MISSYSIENNQIIDNNSQVINLFFCFPYRGVGGVSLLFLRIAEELYKTKAIRCNLIDYEDGFMAKHMDKNSANLVIYSDSSDVVIPANSVIIFQSMTPWSIFPSLKINSKAKIFFWNCHPFNLIPTLPGLRILMQRSFLLSRVILATLLRSYRSTIINMIEILLKNKALVFMDTTNLDYTQKYLGIKINYPTYLPIPAKSSNLNIRNRTFGSKKTFNIAWVGRIVDFKYFILKRTLIDLDKIQNSCRLSLHINIIGNGDYQNKLKNDVSKLSNISVKFTDFISPEKIDNYLLNEVDLLMAMGTSALEGAKLGVPTILLDLSYAEVPEGYLYKWFHEGSGYVIGGELTPTNFKKDNSSLIDNINTVITNFENVSVLSKQYFKKNHSIESVTSKLLELISESNCSWMMLKNANVTKPGFIYSLFRYLRKKTQPL